MNINKKLKYSYPNHQQTVSSVDICCDIHPSNQNQEISSLQTSHVDLDKTKVSFNKSGIHFLKSPAKIQASKIRNGIQYNIVRPSTTNFQDDYMKNSINQQKYNQLLISNKNLIQQNKQYLLALQEANNIYNRQIVMSADKLQKCQQQYQQLGFKFQCINRQNQNNKKMIESLQVQLNKQVTLLTEIVDLKNEKNSNSNKKKQTNDLEIVQKQIKQKIIKKFKLSLNNIKITLEDLLILIQQNFNKKLDSLSKKYEEKILNQTKLLNQQQKLLRLQIQSLKSELFHKQQQIKSLNEKTIKQNRIFLSIKQNLLDQLNLISKENSTKYQNNILSVFDAKAIMLDSNEKQHLRQQIKKLKDQSSFLEQKVKQLKSKDCKICKYSIKTLQDLTQELRQLKIKQSEQYNIKINQLINNLFNFNMTNSNIS